MTVWLVHALVDRDRQMPAPTGTALLLAAAAFAAGRTRRRNLRGAPAAPVPSGTSW